MKRIFLSIITIFAISTSVTAQTVDEIVSKHIEVTGGNDAYKQIKTAKMVGKTQLGPGMEAPMSIISINNKAFRMELTVQGMTMVQAVNGDKGWAIMPFQGNPEPQPMTPEQVKMMSAQLDLTGDFYDYKAKGNQIELVGTDDMEGTEVYKLKVTKKDGTTIYHYLDKSTYYDLKQTQKVKVQDKEMESATLYSNYKKTNTGLVLPFSMSGDMSGEIQWTSIEINNNVDEKIFMMPETKPAAEVPNTDAAPKVAEPTPPTPSAAPTKPAKAPKPPKAPKAPKEPKNK